MIQANETAAYCGLSLHTVNVAAFYHNMHCHKVKNISPFLSSSFQMYK